jgi:hypothetical protein
MSAGAPPTSPPPPPFDTPDGIDPDAYPALKRMLKACGRTSFRMPSSCELFLKQYLSKFQPELELLVTALRRGVPEKIYQHPARDGGFDAFLADLAAALARDANIDPVVAKWAVEAWATALGRPPGFVAPPVVPRVLAPPPPDRLQPQVSDQGVRRIMAGIAAAGGFLGGMLGNGGGLLFILVSGAAVDAYYTGTSVGLGEVALAVVIGISMLAGGVCGGLGGFAGWLFGRGDDRPWAGFAAAFAAAFGTGCLLFFCLGPTLPTAMAMGVSAFGAAFTAASRGGHRH